ncbi:MAG: tRNA (adenosine(37)-N6)-threonylcarbamoyltransferase complex dimerization subunit type 1 TsaB [Bacteroidales bacterium]|nr:tRNA (adenosine(37)-N6)-threonylcarbamoyltransferase complex dimerization subunit type 1 TsaB [Bacteroidales bacterium]
MPRLILIETSTALCSAALSENGKIICSRRSDSGRSHAALTAVFVGEMLAEAGWKVSDCDGVALSSGPGSYTGLRVGSGTAKGLCFGADIPLIAVDSLQVLVNMVEDSVPDDIQHIIPMIDARRMEVYCAIHTRGEGGFERSGEVRNVIVESDSFPETKGGKCLFVGDGALKCREVLQGEFIGCCPEAQGLLHSAERAYNEKRFEDIAYFEPFYLKNFVATVSRKKLF